VHKLKVVKEVKQVKKDLVEQEEMVVLEETVINIIQHQKMENLEYAIIAVAYKAQRVRLVNLELLEDKEMME
jgi:hypothetical protein